VALLYILHVIIAILLITSILMQAGKGGGLAEGFSSAENLLGSQSNSVMVKVSTVLAVMFLGMALVVAVLNARQKQSLMANLPDARPNTAVVNVQKLFDQAPSQTIEINAAAPAEAK
jgi:protein translocase SecG subunit